MRLIASPVMRLGSAFSAVAGLRFSPRRRREESPSPADAGAAATTLPYLPALDGLRALAVAAVLLYHAEPSWVPGGFLGVEVFFVISGYLITSLLLAGRRDSGTTNLRGFWARRARRLLPAVAAVIVGVLAYAVLFLPGEVANLRADALAAAAYVSNWRLIIEDQSYFDTFGRPSLLQHLWSLAVEEQFYVVWPVLFALVLGRVKPAFAAVLTLTGAVSSAVLMAALWEPNVDPSRIYYGTDTRAAGLLFGATLAFTWAPGQLPRFATRVRNLFVSAAGLLALAGLIAITLAIHETDRLLYQGGFTAVALLTALLIAASVHPNARWLTGILGRQPLLWIGTRSYSIYLWHWPVFMLTRPQLDIQIDGLELLALRLAITAVLAETSYRVVETPFRRGLLGREWSRLHGMFRNWRWGLALHYAGTAAVALSVLGSLGFGVMNSEKPDVPDYLAQKTVQTGIFAPSPEDTAAATARPTPLRTTEPSTSPSPTTAPDDTPPPLVSDTTDVIVNSGDPPPGPAPQVTVHYVNAGPVMALGDSVMLGTIDELTSSVAGISIDAAVSRQVDAGTGTLRGWRDAGLLGDAVVVHLGTNGSFTSGQFDEIMGVLSDVRLVLFVNISADRPWVSGNNAVIASGVARHGRAVLVDWHAATYGRSDLFHGDGIHVRPAGASLYAGLIASTLAAYPPPTPEPTPSPSPKPTPKPPTATPTPPPPTITPTPAPPAASPTPAPTANPTPEPTAAPSTNG